MEQINGIKIYLPSADEIINKSPEQLRCSVTHACKSSGAWASEQDKNYEGQLTCWYWLRSATSSNRVNGINVVGEVDISTPNTSNSGVRPALELQLSSYINKSTPSQIFKGNNQNVLKIFEKEVAEGRHAHFVYCGEYPQTFDKITSSKLETLFNNGKPNKELTPTGTWFSWNGQTEYNKNYISLKCPVFEYNGEKYARTFSINSESFEWHKIEPVAYEIENWDDLPQSINPKGNGSASKIKLWSERLLISNIPFQWDYSLSTNPSSWEASFIKHYLEDIFMEESLNVNRKPILNYVISKEETKICEFAFEGNLLLEKITIPSHVTKIEKNAFSHTGNKLQVCLEIGKTKIDIHENAFENTSFKYMYLSKDGQKIIFSCYEDKTLEKNSHRFDFGEACLKILYNNNFRENYVQFKTWREEGKIKFMPPEYTLMIFPSNQIQNYIVNKNNQRWGKLVKTLGFDTLEGTEKNNSLIDLMKIYYAIGGFSDNQGESEKAAEYILKYVAKSNNPNATPRAIGSEIHSRFSKLTLKGKYNKTFAQFFMKYYHNNPDFMNFRLRDKDGYLMDAQDYLCIAHNSFETLLKNYPNRVVNTNEERALLSPRFVAEHSCIIEYESVKKGNELLAEIVGKYGYDQKQFEHIQNVYEEAKKLKDTYIIRADKAKRNDCISFRVLEKDDPLGFVLGDITNCCQVLGGVGQSCVDDGYKNPNAGFIVFEESILDENGKDTGETRILGQAYIWYDPQTKTVCYDNIEIPTKILNELRKGDRTQEGISSKKLMDAVVRSAEAIMSTMNTTEVKVERVTTGEGYNDLKIELSENFQKEEYPIAKHRNYFGYSDARTAQYIIKTYDEVTKKMSANIRAGIQEAKSDIQDISQSIQNQRTM